MKIAKATARYEAWLARRLKIVDSDLKFKHEQMRSGVFPFLRATYYRWAQIWAGVCGVAAQAPFQDRPGFRLTRCQMHMNIFKKHGSFVYQHAYSECKTAQGHDVDGLARRP